MKQIQQEGLYNPASEHDSCGVGFVCHVKGQASHSIVLDALQILENMNHRGASGYDPDSGDGSGILIHTPDAFLRRKCLELGFSLPPHGQYAMGMVFLPQDMVSRHLCERAFEKVIDEYGMEILGWRDVPVDSRYVGAIPKQSEPRVRQIFIAPGQKFFNRADFDKRLWLVRQRAENVIEFGDLPQDARDHFYISILSANRTVYKGMLTATQLRQYYPDLSEPDFESALAMVHSRFSTNTFPTWRLAHPFRYLAHNGEINTLQGNRNWMRARNATLQSDLYGDELKKMFPILTESGSDSATLDNCIQFIATNGRSMAHAVLMVIPEAWQNNPNMDPELRAFYEYHSCLMEPWDGPASISFTNGYLIGAVLDRNGLRPSRYYVTKDDRVIMASEVGVLPIDPKEIAAKWRLQPGRIFLVDMKQGRIINDSEIKQELIDKRPWRRWVKEQLVLLEDLPDPNFKASSEGLPTRTLQHIFGYTNEDLKFILTPMATNGEEPLGSMGNDTPLACLSDSPQPLFNYFKQLFAQVTNPPLDAIREELVTSLWMYLGRRGNLLAETPAHAHLLKIQRPILTNSELEKMRAINSGTLQATTLSILFPADKGSEGLQTALTKLCENAAKSVQDGKSLLILSDRGVSAEYAPIPSLLATAAVHHHLIREGTRTLCDIVVETAEARESHHFCLLIGYGAAAVNPYLALDSVTELQTNGLLTQELTAEYAQKNFIKAANKSLLKVASKMGISTIQSYCGAQIFEALGISTEVIKQYFTNTPSRIGGIGLDIIAREAILRHRRGFPRSQAPSDVLANGGFYQWRQESEYHMWNPDTVAKLQHAVRTSSYATFKDYSKLANNQTRSLCTIRGLLDFEKRSPIPLSEVEPASEIVKRFVTGAMSFGSISKEAHETLAIAMNRLGGKSNTGEGGEDPERFKRDLNGDLRRSAIKQVASARFGVTTEYLVNADELQIKMAQGAKPGEGGQLPGHKVDEYVGKIRHSTPGVQLISPPPHHDIYSIEDLAELIHDLKNVNPAARISVKLVSEVGVGTIAAGVAKCKADHILISGDSGGTGASPLTSIKHAGLPWELGLSEAQQTLVRNQLRGRVVLQTDGQIKTGRDVVIAALLGAEEVGLSTAALISLGCVMMRVCHLNTCPAGVATQDPELRKRFAGKPEYVVNLMHFVAEEVREYMAELGFRHFEDMVGRVECLKFSDLSAHWKAKALDLSPVLFSQSNDPTVVIHKTMANHKTVAIHKVEDQDHGLGGALDHELLKLSARAIEANDKVVLNLPIRNVNRAVGAMLSGKIAQKHGQTGLQDGAITVNFSGSAGQSFGAFLSQGVSFNLEGDANDYVGKGLSGGRIAIFPPRSASFQPEENIIAGNVACYGATSGEVFLRGIVGERFCVRNSGAYAVVEGCGDHGCEYMTGGRVVILGRVGRNFAAGMSGGIAYVFDQDNSLSGKCNHQMVGRESLDEEDQTLVRELLEEHLLYTQSGLAKKLLNNWATVVTRFVKVIPHEYKRALKDREQIEERALLLAKRQNGGGE